jgi:DNA-directed RNA polymerase subunit RPC12/RpoP
MALIYAVVSEYNARKELEAWQRAWVPEGIPVCTSAEAERWRLALLKCPRQWREWRAQVCEPDELDGVQASPEARSVHPAARGRPAMPIRNPTTPMRGVKCPHCQSVHDPKSLTVSHTYSNGNRRHNCPHCGNNFISVFCATL